MASSADDRCRALTGEGERCSRPAQEDGFCHQHDESDPTVDDSPSHDDESDKSDESGQAAGDSGDSEQMADDSEDNESDDSQSVDDEGGESEQAVGNTSDGSHDGDSAGSAGGDIMAVKESVKEVGRELIGHSLDGIIEVTRDGDEDTWRAVVEVVERPSVPDTQDILGKYEIELDADGSVEGYRRVDRYRRVDTDQDSPTG